MYILAACTSSCIPKSQSAWYERVLYVHIQSAISGYKLGIVHLTRPSDLSHYKSPQRKHLYPPLPPTSPGGGGVSARGEKAKSVEYKVCAHGWRRGNGFGLEVSLQGRLRAHSPHCCEIIAFYRQACAWLGIINSKWGLLDISTCDRSINEIHNLRALFSTKVFYKNYLFINYWHFLCSHLFYKVGQFL